MTESEKKQARKYWEHTVPNYENPDKVTEPIDQATKDRIHREVKKILTEKYGLTGLLYLEIYIAGASVWAERLKQERNKAIQWCINSVNNTLGKEELLRKLESLKDKSHE